MKLEPRRRFHLIGFLILLPGVLGVGLPGMAQNNRPVGSVTGKVFCGPFAVPARFAIIRLLSLQSDSGLRTGATVRGLTDMTGSFAISNVPTGTYVVATDYPGYAPMFGGLAEEDVMKRLAVNRSDSKISAQIVNVSENRTTSLTIAMEKGGALTGTVSYADGSPAPKAIVGALLIKTSADSPADVNSRSVLSGVADDKGGFRLAGLPEGRAPTPWRSVSPAVLKRSSSPYSLATQSRLVNAGWCISTPVKREMT